MSEMFQGEDNIVCAPRCWKRIQKKKIQSTDLKKCREVTPQTTPQPRLILLKQSTRQNGHDKKQVYEEEYVCNGGELQNMHVREMCVGAQSSIVT